MATAQHVQKLFSLFLDVVCAIMVFFTVGARSGRSWSDEDRPLKRTYIVEATDYGLHKMNELVNVQEPHLYQIGMWLERDNPARYVAAFNSQSVEAKRLAKFGYASLQATTKLVQQLYSGAESRAAVRGLKLPTISLLHTALHDQCPLRGDQPVDCPESSGRYRTADGRCNNPAHPWWGASMMPLHRFLPSHYRDGLEKVRISVSGGSLPSARLVSSAIHSDRHSDLTSITHMVMQWGQFLDHDLTSSAQSRGFNGSVPKCCVDGGRDFQPLELAHPDCMAIPVPPDDWFYSHFGIRCLEFVRSSPTSHVGCSLGPRDQINQVTSFIDASAIYGSSEKDEDDLRMFRNGLLKYSRVQYRLPLLPAANYKADLCRGQSGHIRCFHAGDKRVNEQPGLIALHTIWLRAHNKIATELSHINPHWRDEKLYQETRRIIGAIMQHITFREFLPIVLGHDVMKLFDLELMKRGHFTGYNIKTNPTAANAFGTAAFRFGHSLVQHSLVRCDRSHHRLLSNVSLHEELTNPANLYNIGSVDRLLLGLCQQPAQKRDEFITEELTNHLFQTPSYGYGMDLAALNIQRGRDHGLAPYTAWREPCGLQPLTDWPDLLQVMSTETQRRLKHIYRDVDDIDLFPGAMAERPVSGGLVGPTFACILAQQFSNLRKGDRFWYENGGFESSFTLAQLQQIRRVTLARMLCDNLDGIDTLQPFVFLTVDNDRNHRVPCDSGYIPHLDLKPWAEHRKEEEYHHQESTDHDHSPSHHIPIYPSYQKPPTEQTPSYHHTTRPSYEEHKPSYLIVELQPPPKPLEENKPTYLIDSNFQSKPTKPQNMYTTTKYPKPEQEHKPTYLIDESFQDEGRPASKRPNIGHKPTNSAYLPVEHKEPDFNNHNYDHVAELPSKLEIEPPGDYHFHHKEEYAPIKPSSGHNHPSHPEYHEEYKPQEGFTSNHYEPHGEYLLHHKPDDEHQVVYKPHGEYSHHEPHDEYPSPSKPHYEHATQSKPYHEYPIHSKPQYEYTTRSKPYHEYPSHSKPQYEHATSSKPYHEYPSHSKPQYEHTTHSKPYHEYPSHSKPQYEHATSSKPYHEYPSHSKPQYEHTTHSKPYHEYSSYSEPQYEHTNQPKPYHEHTTHHYKPQYVYKFNTSHVTSSSEPHYEYISFTKPYDNERIPSTLDYNKYKPRPTKPSSHHDGSYSLLTNPPYKEQHHSESYSSAGRPDYQKPSSSGYYHTSYSYIKVFNEPSYYYLDERKVVGYTNKPNPGLLAADINTSMVQSDASIMEQEPRIAVDNGDNIPADDDDSYIDLTTLTTSFNSAPFDIVTTEGNIANINTTPDEMQETVLSINIINITEDTDINNTAHNTSNIFYNEKQLNFAENINVTMSEFMTTLDSTTTVMNAINTETLNNANDNITLKTFINMNNSIDNVTNSEKKNTFIIFSSKRENETDDSNPSNQNTTNKNTFSSVDIEQEITENNSHLDNNNVNLDTQVNISIDNNIANENIKSVKEQNKTADNSTILHITKFTHITDANIFSNTNIIIDSNLNTDKQNVSIINETEMDGNINSNTETSEEDMTGMVIHESTFDTILTESYMISTITTESKDDWIFTEEEEDNVTIIPEMPTIASDPMALKELPRPMIFEDEESGRGLM